MKNNVLFIISLICFLAVHGAQSNKVHVPCKNRADCVPLYGDQAECQRGSCVCLAADKSEVVSCEPRLQKNRSSLLGGACSSDDSCNIDNSVCDLKEGKCQCMIDYIATSNSRKCLKGNIF